jgi:hypothetical protein
MRANVRGPMERCTVLVVPVVHASPPVVDEFADGLDVSSLRCSMDRYLHKTGLGLSAR